MSKKPMLGVVVGPDQSAPPQEAPVGHDAANMPSPPRSAPEIPPPAPATPPQVAPDIPPPAPATPPQAAPDVPPPEPTAPPKAVAGLSRAEPPPPPPKVVAGLEAQAPAAQVDASGRPLEGPPVSAKREYMAAVKTYEQQVGPNIVRGKMFVESLPTTPSAMPAERRFSPLPGTGYGPDIDMGPGRDYMYAPMPSTAWAMPAERRFSPLPGTGYGPDMDMGPGRDYMYVPISSGQGYPMGGGAPLNVQRSREDFRNLALHNDLDLAKMAEMGPAARRLLDMGSRLDEIYDVPRMSHAGRRPSRFAEPTGPIMVECCERPPPPGYGAPMGRYSAEACPRATCLCMAQEPRIGVRFSNEGRDYAVRPCSRETTAYGGENRPTRRSMSRASDLLDRIRQDIDEHRAENMLEQIRADAASIDDGEPDVRVRPRRNSMPYDSRPPSRNV